MRASSGSSCFPGGHCLEAHQPSNHLPSMARKKCSYLPRRFNVSTGFLQGGQSCSERQALVSSLGVCVLAVPA
ncbi:hypothetical protein YC2023_048504 [Brassica napus]